MATKFRPVVAYALSALALAGCASSPMTATDPSQMVAVSDGNCATFAAKAAKTLQTSNFTPDPLELANRLQPSDSDNDVGSDSADGADTEPKVPLLSLLTQLPQFSTSPEVAPIPIGWQPWTINRNKTPTRYSLTEVDQRKVLHAQADGSASGLYVPLIQRDPGSLSWMWKTRDVIRVADNAVSHREDSPLRIFVAFDGDRSSLSLRDQLMYEMARITTGREMPYATLMYIWGGKRPVGTILNNPHTDRVRMIVVDSGTRHTNEWRCHERDLRADYRKAFGAEPGKILAVGLMTDTDNTKSRAEAWYGDIFLD